MGGGNYSKDWTPDREATYSFPKTNYSSYKFKNDTLSLEDLIQKYASSIIRRGNYSLDSFDEINNFFKLVDNILTCFQKVDKTQSQNLQDEFEKIKLQYRRSRTSIINLFYSNLNSRRKISAFSLNTNFDSTIKIKLANFTFWLDKTLQIYGLLPSEKSKEVTDER